MSAMSRRSFCYVGLVILSFAGAVQAQGQGIAADNRGDGRESEVVESR